MSDVLLTTISTFHTHGKVLTVDMVVEARTLVSVHGPSARTEGSKLLKPTQHDKQQHSALWSQRFWGPFLRQHLFGSLFHAVKGLGACSQASCDWGAGSEA